jgi:osmotically-inducible protein OsmY
VVTLHGIASNARERAEIEAAAREVPGVSDVANRLRLTGH